MKSPSWAWARRCWSIPIDPESSRCDVQARCSQTLCSSAASVWTFSAERFQLLSKTASKLPLLENEIHKGQKYKESSLQTSQRDEETDDCFLQHFKLQSNLIIAHFCFYCLLTGNVLLSIDCKNVVMKYFLFPSLPSEALWICSFSGAKK